MAIVGAGNRLSLCRFVRGPDWPNAMNEIAIASKGNINVNLKEFRPSLSLDSIVAAAARAAPGSLYAK